MTRRISRRLFARQLSGLTLTLGLSQRARAGLLWPYRSQGVWLAGDHHIHTCYSMDGLYEIAEQIESAARGGLDFCVITDHGGPEHSRVLLQRAYPELVAARKKYPHMTVFQGLEWNIPDAEHGTLIVPPSGDEAQIIANFEAHFDQRGSVRSGPATTKESDAVRGLAFLQRIAPQALFFANHPSRRGLDSPHELRAWSDAAPTVMRGFEGAPGHGAAPLIGVARGYYGETPGAQAHPGYPAHAFRTWGGHDYAVADVGGLWDALLGEGRPFYITANSDAHRYLGDRAEVDRSQFRHTGRIEKTGRQKARGQKDYHDPDEDYLPGAYAKTVVYAQSRQPIDILDGMRKGQMFTVLGGLIDGLELVLSDGKQACGMGGTMEVTAPATIDLSLRLRLPVRANWNQQFPTLHHVDVIVGELQKSAHPDQRHNPTAHVTMRFEAADLRRGRRGTWVELHHRFRGMQRSFYVRVRGTSTACLSPAMDTLGSDPWQDLWFYSNPVQVRVH